MKKIFSALPVMIYGTFILYFCAVHAAADSVTWVPVETREVDWNQDGKKDKIMLEAIKEIVEAKDPGDFHRIRIQIEGVPEFVLENREGWVRVRTENKPSRVKTILKGLITFFVRSQPQADDRFKNILPSDYVALTPVSPRENEELVLLLFDYQYASSPGKLTVIGLDQAGNPKVLFDREFELTKLDDIDGDAVPELIGQPWYGEVFGPDEIFHLYVPTHVYSFRKGEEGIRLEMNAELSAKYSQEHNYGWVDPETAREYVVVVPKDGGESRLMKLEEAERVYNVPQPVTMTAE